jgi:hypothetical protein
MAEVDSTWTEYHLGSSQRSSRARRRDRCPRSALPASVAMASGFDDDVRFMDSVAPDPPVSPDLCMSVPSLQHGRSGRPRATTFRTPSAYGPVAQRASRAVLGREWIAHRQGKR